MFALAVMVIEMLMSTKNGHNVGKFFKCIWKILFSSFRAYHGLLGSEPLFARYQPLKIQDFETIILNQQFFYITILNISQTVTPKPINHTIFWKNAIRSFRDIELFCPHWLIFCRHQEKNTKYEPFLTI